MNSSSNDSQRCDEFILAETLKALYHDDYNEFLLACDEICLPWDNSNKDTVW